MSETSLTSIDYTLPRTVWVLGIQLFYTFMAMIPVYYYMRELLSIRATASQVVIYLPVLTAMLLFFLELRLNDYFWVSEKIYKKRDSFNSSIKSFLVIIFSYYFVFLFIFGYFLSGSKTYKSFHFNNEVSQLIAEDIASVITIYLIVILMLNIQNQRFQQIWKRRSFSRRK